MSEFRGRLVAGGAEEQLLDKLLKLCREQKLLAVAGGNGPTPRTRWAVRALSRLECATATLRAAVNALVIAATPSGCAATSMPHGWSAEHGAPASTTGHTAVRTARVRRSGRARRARAASAVPGLDAPAWLCEAAIDRAVLERVHGRSPLRGCCRADTSSMRATSIWTSSWLAAGPTA
jgi:transposase